MPTTSYQEDQKIIEELTSTDTKQPEVAPVVEETAPVVEEVAPVIEDTTPVVEAAPVIEEAKSEPKNSGMDLDALLSSNEPTPIVNEVVAATVINQPVPVVEAPIQTTPGSNFQVGAIMSPMQISAPIPTIETNTALPTKHKGKSFKTLLIFVLLA